MADTALYVTIMKDSLERKKNYLAEILDMTKSQGNIARAEEFDEDAFDDCIQCKEILIGNVNEIDKGFTAVYDRIRSEILENPDSYKSDLKTIQGLIKDCIDYGMKIEAEEDRNKASLEQIFASKFKGLKQLKQSKKVANKYYKTMANGMVNDSWLYDTKK